MDAKKKALRELAGITPALGQSISEAMDRAFGMGEVYDGRVVDVRYEDDGWLIDFSIEVHGDVIDFNDYDEPPYSDFVGNIRLGEITEAYKFGDDGCNPDEWCVDFMDRDSLSMLKEIIKKEIDEYSCVSL